MASDEERRLQLMPSPDWHQESDSLRILTVPDTNSGPSTREKDSTRVSPVEETAYGDDAQDAGRDRPLQHNVVQPESEIFTDSNAMRLNLTFEALSGSSHVNDDMDVTYGQAFSGPDTPQLTNSSEMHVSATQFQNALEFLQSYVKLPGAATPSIRSSQSYIVRVRQLDQFSKTDLANPATFESMLGCTDNQGALLPEHRKLQDEGHLVHPLPGNPETLPSAKEILINLLEEEVKQLLILCQYQLHQTKGYLNEEEIKQLLGQAFQWSDDDLKAEYIKLETSYQNALRQLNQAKDSATISEAKLTETKVRLDSEIQGLKETEKKLRTENWHLEQELKQARYQIEELAKIESPTLEELKRTHESEIRFHRDEICQLKTESERLLAALNESEIMNKCLVEKRKEPSPYNSFMSSLGRKHHDEEKDGSVCDKAGSSISPMCNVPHHRDLEMQNVELSNKLHDVQVEAHNLRAEITQVSRSPILHRDLPEAIYNPRNEDIASFALVNDNNTLEFMLDEIRNMIPAKYLPTVPAEMAQLLAFDEDLTRNVREKQDDYDREHKDELLSFTQHDLQESKNTEKHMLLHSDARRAQPGRISDYQAETMDQQYKELIVRFENCEAEKMALQNRVDDLAAKLEQSRNKSTMTTGEPASDSWATSADDQGRKARSPKPIDVQTERRTSKHQRQDKRIGTLEAKNDDSYHSNMKSKEKLQPENIAPVVLKSVMELSDLECSGSKGLFDHFKQGAGETRQKLDQVQQQFMCVNCTKSKTPTKAQVSASYTIDSQAAASVSRKNMVYIRAHDDYGTLVGHMKEWGRLFVFCGYLVCFVLGVTWAALLGTSCTPSWNRVAKKFPSSRYFVVEFLMAFLIYVWMSLLAERSHWHGPNQYSRALLAEQRSVLWWGTPISQSWLPDLRWRLIKTSMLNLWNFRMGHHASASSNGGLI